VSHWRGWLLDPRLLLIFGVLGGIGLGLLIGWLLWPVTFYDTDVFDLRADYRDDFVVMVGTMHSLEHDTNRARELLSLLSDPNSPQSVEAIVVDVTERYIARGANPTEIHNLVELAQALDSVTTPMQPYVNGQQP
jgi:hypothetical protein